MGGILELIENVEIAEFELSLLEPLICYTSDNI